MCALQSRREALGIAGSSEGPSTSTNCVSTAISTSSMHAPAVKTRDCCLQLCEATRTVVCNHRSLSGAHRSAPALAGCAQRFFSCGRHCLCSGLTTL